MKEGGSQLCTQVGGDYAFAFGLTKPLVVLYRLPTVHINGTMLSWYPVAVEVLTGRVLLCFLSI